MSVALVAWSRCLVTLKAGKESIITYRRNRIIIFILVRIYSFALLIPANFHVSLVFILCLIAAFKTYIQILGQIGYNCLHGNCYLIPNEDNFNGLSPAFIIDVIGFSIPFTIILTSYGYILILVWKERNHLKRHRRQHYSQSSSLIYKFSWTIFLICFCFLAFVLPFNICDFLEETGVFSVDHSIRLAMLYLKWVHFAINFVIYAATSDQYRKAYLFFLKRVM